MRNKKKNPTGKVLMGVGALLVAAALLLAAYNIWDERQAAISASQALAQLRVTLPNTLPAQNEQRPTDESVVGSAEQSDILPEESLPAPEDPEEKEIPDYVLNPDMDMPEQTINGWDYIGVLEIPALKLSLPILSWWSDEALKVAPCRYVGSAYTNDLIIAGHNFRSHFANLKNVPEGSVVRFTDMDGNRFTYEVVLIETLHSTDVEEMKSGDWDLSLFTCTMNGQYRATVRCNRIIEK